MKGSIYEAQVNFHSVHQVLLKLFYRETSCWKVSNQIKKIEIKKKGYLKSFVTLPHTPDI